MCGLSLIDCLFTQLVWKWQIVCLRARSSQTAMPPCGRIIFQKKEKFLKGKQQKPWSGGVNCCSLFEKRLTVDTINDFCPFVSDQNILFSSTAIAHGRLWKEATGADAAATSGRNIVKIFYAKARQMNVAKAKINIIFEKCELNLHF